MDSGNRRRYIEVPFDNDLSKDPLVKFDGKIKTTMRENKEFLEAVLAWAVAGAVDWFANGLHLPASVEAATAALFASNDFLSKFTDDMCVKDPAGTVTVKMLWDSYERWCESQGEEPAQGRVFNRMLEERHFERKVARVDGFAAKVWTGIRLKNYDEEWNSELNSEMEVEGGLVTDVLQVVKNEIQQVLLLESPENWDWDQFEIVERAVLASVKEEIGAVTGNEDAWSMRDKYIGKAIAETRSLMTLN